MTGPNGAADRRHHDLRLLAPALVVWATTWALLAAGPATAYRTSAICGLGASLVLVRARHVARTTTAGGTTQRAGPWPPRVAVVMAALLCASAAAAGTGLRLSAVVNDPIRELAEAEAHALIDAVVTGDPGFKPSRDRPVVLVRARAEVVRVQRSDVDVRVPVLLIGTDDAWRALVPGQRIRVTARLSPPRHAELLAAVGIVRGPPLVLGMPPALQRAAERVRARLRAACEILPRDHRGVLPGMVVGDTSRLAPEIAEDFATAGLTHLMVVSGANLAIVVGAVLAACRLAGLGRRRAPLLATVALLAFVLVARPEPSVLRATVMSLIGLLAYFTGRERQGVPALCAAVLVLVLIDPGLARSYGFALSVLATGGLLVLAPPWRDRLARRLPRPVAEALAVSLAAQLACLPLLVMLTGEIGLVAVAANLLATPAVPLATLSGALAAAIAPIALAPARFLVWPAGLAVGWIIGVARTASRIPYATVPWQGGVIGAAALLLAALIAYLVLRNRMLLALAAAALTGIVVAGAVLRVTASRWPPPGWLFVACDVGQGDASVLSTGPGQAIVVDTGPEPDLIDGCLDRLNVRAVPLLVLTHPHADHIDGTPGVRRDRTIGAVLTSAQSNGRELRLTSGLAVRPTTAGRQWRVGAVTLTVLGPWTAEPRLHSTSDGADINNASIVLVARRPGFSVLLTGDIETEAQRSLLSNVPPVQVLKVPHHGARYQEPAFLESTRAKISITSLGKDNDYGHPAPSTLSLLQRLGMHIYRTDRDGDIAIIRTSDGPATVTRKGGKVAVWR
ncbi:ComEC/Rec2 family competence protein [Thermomonospora umbrina]|uniref:Competence protein ComEC n=1 Tax=Thermomonospora umbrina TaxID=111806 RepID=A0A3D9SZ22_9ACTN|nr:ComEC/Rec2 family competence protein [Thermomonospora umbrina]REE99283.1 competence protein ComEC [Thermomonospora umbrina]